MYASWTLNTHDQGRGAATSATKFKFLSFNANSIGKNPKRQKVLHHIRKKNPDFILTCDTRISKCIESIVREKWEGRCLFSSFSSQARGVAIFIKKDNPSIILNTFQDQGVNIVAIQVLLEDKKILIEALYGPNQDTPEFYTD